MMEKPMQMLIKTLFAMAAVFASAGGAQAAVIEFNNAGGTTATNGLHFYIEDTTKIQVRRLNNSGQVYAPGVVPPSTSLDNGVFIRANGLVYGPSHAVSTFNPTGGMYNSFAITPTLPANPSSSGVQQSATGAFGITSGPQVSIAWKYTTPLDFLTAEVTLTIPLGYAVSAVNPVRYYHVFDTYLGGSDNGCGVSFLDAGGNRVIGTYPPGSGCTSSTAIPAGVSIVESFRERSGLLFTRYCASGWNSFFANGTTNCSVLQTAQMSNAVATTSTDTGIGIELDFIASGTYTFSYDFVVGSPTVPPYDHLEIRHDGAATLCPETVTVLACTSSTVPCPVANLVSTGTLTGSVTTTPAVPAVSATPAIFSLGGAGTTASVVLQGTSPGGVYTLGSSGLSTVPLNGTKCWNTATLSQSCAITVSATPCVSNYECMETGVTYNNLTSTPAARNPLYTKLAGTGFAFDVIALQANGAQATAYTAASGVTVELFDDATPAASCSAYAGPVASQAVTFVAADNGRKTLTSSFNVANAYSKLRCRVRDTNLTPNIYGCSSDDFSVRPTATTLVTSASAAAPSATSTPVIKAGANFTLRATTTPAAAYAGAQTLDTSKLTAQITSQDTTQQTGGVVGTLTPATLTGNAAAVNATYSEAGHLYLAAGAYRDDAFTAVDSATGDCVTSTASDANLADTLVGGKYGCSIGNKTAVSLGRFIPDHFAVTAGTPVAACTVHPVASGSYTPTDFSYFGQDGFTTPFNLAAQNIANATTQNYTGVFARLGLGTWTNYGFTAPSLPAGATLAASAQAPTGTWASGLATVTAKHSTTRPTALGGPTSVIVNALPVDLDGVTLPAAAAVNTGTLLRYGRLRLGNALGPHTRALRMPVEAQHWNGSAFARNQDDSCTVVPASAWSFGNYVTKPSTGVTFSPVGVSMALVGGSAFLTVPVPINGRVTFDASINLATTGAETATSSCLKNLALATPTRPWAPTVTTATPSPVRPSLLHLLGQWCDATYVNNPSGRGSFGLYRGAEAFIFQRENY